MRASEAKLRGRMTIVVPIARRPGCEYGGVLAGSLSLRFAVIYYGFGSLRCLSCARACVFAVVHMGCKELSVFLIENTILGGHLIENTILGGHDLHKHLVK